MSLVRIETPAGLLRRPGGPTLAIWSLIAFLVLALAVSFPLAGLTLAPADLLRSLAFSVLCLGLSAFYTVKRPDERIARLFRVVPEFALITFFAGALSYAAAAARFPLWDATFDAWDKALGFDWPGVLAFHVQHGWTLPILGAGYSSMLPQMALLPIALVTARAFTEADRFMLAFGIAGIVTVGISAVMPGLCAGYLYRDAIAAYPGLDLGWGSVAQVLALRAGEMTHVSMAQADGIVTLPSFHTVSAVLFVIGFWHVPWLRWPAVALNLILIAATPIIGGHYLVDILCGLAVAFLARALAVRIIPAKTG